MKTFPNARNENIVVRNIGDETLIYDLVSNRAFCLNATLAKVYSVCDGKITFEEFKSRHSFTDDLIYFSLDELRRENLIKTDTQYQSPLALLTRREIAKRVGLSTLIALPLITSLVAPNPAEAASLPGLPCATANQNCPFDGTFTQGNCCDGLRCLDNGFCIACRSSGVLFNSYAISLNPAGCTVAECNLLPQKNWCCNLGNSTAQDNGLNSCICRCQ